MRMHRQGHRQPDRCSRSAARMYALLLRLYPQAHRRAFGQQMLQTFQDHYRDVLETHSESELRFWLGVLSDVGRSLGREYLTTLRTNLDERTGAMKTGVAAVLAAVAGLLLLLGLRVWLSPQVLSAPHGGGSALSSVAGVALLLLAYAALALGLLRARWGVSGRERDGALRRATIIGVLLGVGVLAAITVDTIGGFESTLSVVFWGLVVLAAPLGWGVAGLLATRAGGSWRLGMMVALWSGMVSALMGTVGEVASTILALPRLVQYELSNPDYLAWHQPDVQSYAIASALALSMLGLVLAPVVASVAGGIGSHLGKASSPVALPD